MSANIGIHSLLFLNLLVQYLRNFNEMWALYKYILFWIRVFVM
jgi:hypothetical protein